VLANDLEKGICDGRRVVCLVVDEAHKASGDHAYIQGTYRMLIRVNQLSWEACFPAERL
jgi:ERCC4-related helicase